ncbi:MAG: sodium/glutamate symporter [Acidobacteriota bacterium]
MQEYLVDGFLTYTLGIVVFFVGWHLNRRIAVLRDFNIPEPVTGGLLAALVVFAIYLATGTEVAFELRSRDLLLVYFFASIGLNARIRDLVNGGRPLLTLLALTLAFIAVQNAVGVGAAALVGAPLSVGVLAGSTSLIGGHGTAIAWAPEVVALGVENALEIGIACATLGLVLASLIGGPIARFLIERGDLSSRGDQEPMVGLEYEGAEEQRIDHLNLMAVILALHITMIVGYILNDFIASTGLKLPLFVTCLLTGILFSNTIPFIFRGMPWPARTPAMAVVSDFSLGLFLAMSLMSMQLWTIADLAGPLLIILGCQTLAAVLYVVWILFPLMGRGYQAAVLSAGFGGFALGATPTAIANMTAVTKKHGPSPTAFIILPLVAAFFVDITNAFVIRFALSLVSG